MNMSETKKKIKIEEIYYATLTLLEEIHEKQLLRNCNKNNKMKLNRINIIKDN